MTSSRAGTGREGPRVRFFATCLGDRFFADAARDAVELLRSLGVRVDVPDGLTCCGQPAWNAGHEGRAREMAEHLVARLPGDTPVVLPSGSCAGMIRRSFPSLGVAAPPVYELAEYVVEVLGVTRLGRGLEGVRVAYHHGCHALRELGVREEPLLLLEGAGAEIVPWEAAEECCGFGGLFAVKLPWVSAAMSDRKLDALSAAGLADVLCSADGGCLLQLGGRLAVRERGRREGADPVASDVVSKGAGPVAGGRAADGRPEVLHLASLLLRARDAAPAAVVS